MKRAISIASPISAFNFLLSAFPRRFFPFLTPQPRHASLSGVFNVRSI
jgi:hypothetical protein